jgi:hypothetical protein
MSTELAYTYLSVAAIMVDRGFSIQEIKVFLRSNKTSTGYIKQSKIPTKK